MNLDAGMNRLSPCIVRKTGPHAAAIAWPDASAKTREASSWLDDLRLFYTGFFGGLVFFSVLLG